MLFFFNGLRDHTPWTLGLKPYEILLRQPFLLNDFLLHKKSAGQIIGHHDLGSI